MNISVYGNEHTANHSKLRNFVPTKYSQNPRLAKLEKIMTPQKESCLQYLLYDSSSSLWKKKTPKSAMALL